jgi:hypothetical protein
MKRWTKWSIVSAAILLVLLTAANIILERNARRFATDNGAFRDFHDVTEAQIEREIRDTLPLGSPRPAIEDYLSNRGMRFWFDNSKNEIDAAAPYLKGSNFIISSTMGIKFQFDDAAKLESIHTSIELTGP